MLTCYSNRLMEYTSKRQKFCSPVLIGDERDNMQKTREYVLLDFKTVDYPEVIQQNDVQLVKTALLTQWPCQKNANSKNNSLQFVEAYSMIHGKRPKETIMCISDYHVFSALYQNQEYNKTPTESWLNKMYDFLQIGE